MDDTKKTKQNSTTEILNHATSENVPAEGCHVFMIRHGERADLAKGLDADSIEMAEDPHLTKKGE